MVETKSFRSMCSIKYCIRRRRGGRRVYHKNCEKMGVQSEKDTGKPGPSRVRSRQLLGTYDRRHFRVHGSDFFQRIRASRAGLPNRAIRRFGKTRGDYPSFPRKTSFPIDCSLFPIIVFIPVQRNPYYNKK